MKAALDTSVIVAAVDGGDPDHTACRNLLLSGKFSIHAHALSEVFSTLTGGRLAIRVSATDAAAMLRQWIAPRLTVAPLGERDLLRAYDEASARGIRGGAIYDYLHLVAARRAHSVRLYTLNVADFRSFRRPGDPDIVHP